MQCSSEGVNIAELVNQLQKEKLLNDIEREALQNLNDEVEQTSLEVLQSAWICLQQKLNWSSLIAARCEADSVKASQNSSLLEATNFIDAGKVLKSKDFTILGELLGWLKASPTLVSFCLSLGEENMPPNLIPNLISGLFGSLRSREDTETVIEIQRALIRQQLSNASDPRKMFRQGNCATARLLCAFRENHAPVRQFLFTALHGPLMAALAEDEFFLDVDPDKAMERFSREDIIKKFGQPNSNEYKQKVARYRRWMVSALVTMAGRFIVALKENLLAFPAAMAGIIQYIVATLKENSSVSEKETHAVCTDLILTHYICPAMISPDAHGLIDIPISYIARCNLMQAANIIQTLALHRYKEVDAKVRDVYSRFEKDCVFSIVELIAKDSSFEPAPIQANASQRTNHVQRALFTKTHLDQLILYLKEVSGRLNNNAGNAPDDILRHNLRAKLHDLLKNMPNTSPCNSYTENQAQAFDQAKESDNSSASSSSKKQRILSKVNISKVSRSVSGRSNNRTTEQPPTVLMIHLIGLPDQDYIGMLPESKFLERYYSGEEGSERGVALPPASEKRARFSVSHDEMSLGNTSDNLEAISEAASNHSVTSSLELDQNDNDNLSDMVSANVSGRGSPNISGRETPSSQVTDNEQQDRDVPPPTRVILPPPARQPQMSKIQKQTRNDIDDKFCKFEIKKIGEGDETVSIISDTWSTDVLASDCEACDHPPQNVSRCTIVPDVSETASESAWSIDVIASDSDRNTEVDTDDCVSVAARSDTSSTLQSDTLQNGVMRSQGDESPKSAAQVPFANIPQPGCSNQVDGSSGNIAQLSNNEQPNNRFNPNEAVIGNEFENQSSSQLMNRKSILVNGYPVMTNSVGPQQHQENIPEHVLNNNQTRYSSNGASSSQSTCQWVADYFPEQVEEDLTARVSQISIHKSITFHASPDKRGAVSLEELRSNVRRSSGAFFNKFKMLRRNGPHTSAAGDRMYEEEQKSDVTKALDANETSDDILAKYRRKTSTGSDRVARRVRLNDQPLSESNDRSEGALDMENSDMFESVKAKLRTILSNPELQCPEYIPSVGASRNVSSWTRGALTCQGSEGSRVREAPRLAATAALADALRADLAARQPYITYLYRSRRRLARMLASLQEARRRIVRERNEARRGVASARALQLFERIRARDRLLFLQRSDENELMDDKVNRFVSNIKALIAEIKADESFEGSDDWMLSSVSVAVERASYAHFYLHLIFPNGEGDIARDHLLSEHIRCLTVSTSASSAGVRPRHLWAAPFSHAQTILSQLTVWRTPADKLDCVIACVRAIMSLLSLGGGPPTADDLTPVLVFVVIKVNPPSLLSTIQLVNSLGRDVLNGEALYWWTHFCAAVTYIKTMEYNNRSSQPSTSK